MTHEVIMHGITLKSTGNFHPPLCGTQDLAVRLRFQSFARRLRQANATETTYHAEISLLAAVYYFNLYVVLVHIG